MSYHGAARLAVELYLGVLVMKRSFWAKLFSLIFVFGSWEVIGHFANPFTFPTFSKVVFAFIELLSSSELSEALSVSVKGLVLGFIVVVLLGLVIGSVMAYTRFIGRIIDVYVTILLAAPIAALIPILIIAFGLGLTTKVMVIVLMGISVMAINTMYGLRSADNTLLEMAYSFGATSRQTFFKIVIPCSLPMLMAGVRMGFAQCFVGMITAELLVVSEGLGKLLTDFSANFKAASLFATVLLLMFIGSGVISLLQVIETHLFKWKPKTIR